MGRAAEPKLAVVALADPLGAPCSGVLTVESLGTEFVVEARGVRPGWYEGRVAVAGPLFVEGRAAVTAASPCCGEVMAERISSPPIGMSPDVGVGREYPGEVADAAPATGESLERNRLCVAGES
jgi:hypothetical protein